MPFLHIYVQRNELALDSETASLLVLFSLQREKLLPWVAAILNVPSPEKRVISFPPANRSKPSITHS